MSTDMFRLKHELHDASATCGAGTADTSGALEFNTGFKDKYRVKETHL